MSKKQKLDAYLAEVFKQFISIKDDDFRRAQEVFKNVFDQVKQRMKEQCNFFAKYSNQVLYAGSVYDGIKVSRMDEFDMDIVIKLPISYEEITLENDQPGFLRMKITNAFDNLDKQQHWESCHKVTREWRDSDKYLLQNKFRHWMHGIVSKAMNDLKGQADVNGTIYLVSYKESGPAYTLNIRNKEGDEEFKLDVDLVPVIRFMHPRWPEGYKMIESTGNVRDWLVVPKPSKAVKDSGARNRGWRLSFQDYEKEMMKGCEALKTTIRLVKKLRDGLELKSIASYYIKTLFLWKIEQEEDKSYWRNKISVTFRGMVETLYLAVKDKKIMYFWHPDNNLLEGVRPTLLLTYEAKLKEVLDAIDANDVEKVVKYLLTTDEMTKFKASEFYVRVSATKPAATENNGVRVDRLISTESSQSSNSSNSMGGAISAGVRALNDELDSVRLNSSDDKMSDFERRLANLEDKVNRLEMAMEKMEFDKQYSDLLKGIPVEGVKTNADTKRPNDPLIVYE